MARSRTGLLVVSVALLGAGSVLLFNPGFRHVLGLDGFFAAAPDTAAGNLSDTFQGLIGSAAIAASSGNQPVFIDEVITGYSASNDSAIPAEITTIRPVFGCRLTKPMEGSLVGHVTAGESDMATTLTTYSDLHLAEAVRAFVDAYRSLGHNGTITLQGPQFQAYDVAVTETSRPVYLVLESQGGNRLWNIHLAEGARIERVILLGGDQAAIANLDPVIPVEAMLTAGLQECGIVPAYQPSPGQIADTSAEPGQQPMRQPDVTEILAKSEAYDIWFRDSFDVFASESRVGFDRGTISVIGPIPSGEAPKAVWTTMDEADISATRDQYLDIEGQTAPGEDFAGRVLSIVTRFAHGDLERLRIGGGT